MNKYSPNRYLAEEPSWVVPSPGLRCMRRTKKVLSLKSKQPDYLIDIRVVDIYPNSSLRENGAGFQFRFHRRIGGCPLDRARRNILNDTGEVTGLQLPELVTFGDCILKVLSLDIDGVIKASAVCKV